MQQKMDARSRNAVVATLDFRIGEFFDTLLRKSSHNWPAPPKSIDGDVFESFVIAEEGKISCYASSVVTC
ncbi:hypothetical protein DY000_02035531 [Brassica cretica]|uniref:Uncharacterized protein n=1 Tax=Brassica cretica TaxID=69181 RepID=A0ABQ7DLA3_BRACR|nr:hypothetical protein DY000_02035531 [Brassica cretica]